MQPKGFYEMTAAYFTVDDIKMTRLWHCFGNQRQSCNLDEAIGLLRASGTNVLPINTHSLSTTSGRDGLQIGYSGVTIDDLENAADLSGIHKMLNINLCTTSDEAVAKTQLAYEVSGVTLIKLEVLSSNNIDGSNDEDLILAVEKLKNDSPDLKVLPLISSDPKVAKELVRLGCPLLRIMGSEIGGMSGIQNPSQFEECCNYGVPVILDGGVGSVDHLLRALELGAQGCLVNSMLFNGNHGPVAAMKDFQAHFSDAATRFFRNPIAKDELAIAQH